MKVTKLIPEIVQPPAEYSITGLTDREYHYIRFALHQAARGVETINENNREVAGQILAQLPERVA